MLTIASIFSGGEGVGVGAQAAGLKHLWGIEFDERIAGVARANGFNSIYADVNTVDLRLLEPPDVLHASPVCKNASVAKAKRGEQDLDMQSGIATANFIRYLRPKVFTLENVYGYRKFEAFRVICDALTECGYKWDTTHCNAADFGVPQTRKRLILRATRYGRKVLPPYPEAVRPWNGWYAAIEDLIPSLPESKFAPWQLKRLPRDLFDTCFVDTTGNTSRDITVRESDEPTPTVGAGWMRRPQNVPCAFIAPGGNANSFSIRIGEEPARTVGDTERVGNISRAFIVNTREMHDYREQNALTLRQGEQPVYAIAASSGVDRHKAFLVRGGNAKSEGGIVLDADSPASTVDRSKLGRERAWLECGRVVKMTTRALARFQSIPDWYILPTNNALACTVIGNAVAPLMYEKIVKGLAETL